MEIFIKVFGKKIKQMGKGNMSIIMEQHIKEDGLMINRMDLVYKFGQIVQNMKDNILMVKKMVKENFYGLMDLSIKEIS